jgi:hypothetical protein
MYIGDLEAESGGCIGWRVLIRRLLRAISQLRSTPFTGEIIRGYLLDDETGTILWLIV